MNKFPSLNILLIIISLLLGCNSNNPQKTALLNFREYLDQLPKSELFSISKASKEYRKNFTAAAPEMKDSAFLDFRSFYYDVINSYYEIFYNNKGLLNELNANNNNDPRVKELKSTLDQNGLRISKTEGGYYIDESPVFLYSQFKNYVSRPVSEYLLIRRKELEEGFSEDSKLLISYNSLGDRITTWEKYLNDYPTSPLSAEAKFSYHLYLNSFITGLDNSPVAVDNILLPEMKKVYSDFIRKNNNLESGKIVEKFYSIVSNNNFHLTSDLDDFYKDNQIESMKEMELPTR
ncbi:MAG: hypothetical protein P4L35_07280 [Ignavibacteriaceae bacterium]|nr:hypothetical protein [Ignavibacteriaceae bacterium]